MSLPGNHKYKCLVCPNIFYWPIRGEQFKNKKFFKFPSDCAQRKKWCEILNLSNVTKSMHLCEDHFTDDAFTNTMKNRLCKYACPYACTGTKSRQERIPSQKLPLQGDKVSPRRTKVRSKFVKHSRKSKNDKNEGTGGQMDNYEPQMKEFENDNKFEVFYLDPKNKKICSRKPSESGSETDEASESNGIDHDNNFQEIDEVPLDSQHQKSEQASLGIDRLCRICLATFSLTHLTKCPSLVDLFVHITNIEVKADDNLPKYICVTCIRKLVEISDFVSMAKRNYGKLKQTMSVNEEAKIDSSGDEDEEESLSVEKNESVLSPELLKDTADSKSLTKKLSIEMDSEKPMGSGNTILNNIDLPENKSKKPLLKRSKGKRNDRDVHVSSDQGSKLLSPLGKAYFSEETNDFICWKCGVLLVGMRVPKALANVPTNKIKFQCMNCSKPEISSNKKPKIDETKSTSFNDGDRLKVHPGESSSEEEKKIRCITCSESFPLSEFVTHQLQKHSVKKRHRCSVCFLNFPRLGLLKRHEKRHTLLESGK